LIIIENLEIKGGGGDTPLSDIHRNTIWVWLVLARELSYCDLLNEKCKIQKIVKSLNLLATEIMTTSLFTSVCSLPNEE